MKRNEGFTLVELLCAIVAGSIVTAATATILLLGLRMNANASELATQDNQAVICLTVMENMLKSEHVVNVNEESDQKEINVKIDDTTTDALFTYSSATKELRTSSGAVLLDDITDCEFSIEDGLLTIKLSLDDTPLDETPFIKTIRLITGQTVLIGS